MVDIVKLKRGSVYPRSQLKSAGLGYEGPWENSMEIWGTENIRYVLREDGDRLRFCFSYKILNSTGMKGDRRIVPKY